MKIAIWLTHPEVECWNFRPHNLAVLREELPGAEITVCQTPDDFLRALPGAETAVRQTPEDFLRELPDADVACVWRFEQDWFKPCRRLRVLSTPSAGRDFFSVQLPAGVELWNGAFHGEIIGETVAAWVLAECRGVVAAERLAGTNSWPRREMSACLRAARGTHAAIIGFGSIGRWIGKYLKAFGVRLTGVGRTVRERPDYFTVDDRLATIAELDRILPETDHLILALPSDTGTDDLIDRRRLGLLPPRAVVYNIGRGNCLDENALAEFLRAGKLAGAYLDVFKREPLPDNSPLRGCRNALLMPHASAIAPNYLDLYAREFARRLRAGKNLNT